MSVRFESCSKGELEKKLKARLMSKLRTVIFTPNSSIMLRAQKSKKALSLLRRANINLPDGAGVIIASRLTGTPIKERICGIDAALCILDIAQKEHYSVFLLGGKAGVAEKATKMLRRQYEGLKICGAQHGYFKKSGPENASVIEKIKAADPDILFVCFGFPLQEAWISANKALLPHVKLFIGLGGTLDVLSGNVKRAPRIVQKMSCEWLWRALCEPKRLKNLIDIPLFLLEAARTRVKK